MLDRIIEFMFVFAVCSTIGWIMEFFYRSIGEKRLVNPGFLSGCCLPIYGTGGLALYMLCIPLESIVSMPLRLGGVFLGGMVVMTLIELIGGAVILKYYNLRLWDYTMRKFNYKGLICLRFSLYWGICCLVFYCVIYGVLQDLAINALAGAGGILLVGFYFGIFASDMGSTLHLANAVKNYARELKVVVNFEHLKDSASEHLKMGDRSPRRVLLIQNGALREYMGDLRRSTQEKAEAFKMMADENLRGIREKAEEFKERAEDNIRNAGDELRERAEENLKNMSEEISEEAARRAEIRENERLGRSER